MQFKGDIMGIVEDINTIRNLIESLYKDIKDSRLDLIIQLLDELENNPYYVYGE
jgi:hypothetical protein